MAKPIPTTKPTRKPKNNTKHQRGDKNGLKLTGPIYTILLNRVVVLAFRAITPSIHIFSRPFTYRIGSSREENIGNYTQDVW